LYLNNSQYIPVAQTSIQYETYNSNAKFGREAGRR
jgi:hypothetical protein